MSDDDQWWWCLRHERVEHGEGCPHSERLGPYPTEEAARNWKKKAEENTEAWDDEDERWRKQGYAD